MSRYLEYFIILHILAAFILLNPLTSESQARSDPTIHRIQKKLIALGYRPGPIDGIWGKKTSSALRQFQKDQGLPLTGKLDRETASLLSFSEEVPTQKESSFAPSANDQIVPSETAGTCLESNKLLKEYQKNNRQFDIRFNEVPLCISGYMTQLGEKPDYFYIDILGAEQTSLRQDTRQTIQCRIETLNELHRRLLKNSLNISEGNKIQVKGIYHPSTDSNDRILILNQCYIIKADNVVN